MMRRSRLLFFRILWVAIACASLSAQTTTLRVQSRIVLLDVAVTDSTGKPVTDLRQDEFRVFEQQVEQRIVSFEQPSAHQLPPDVAGKMVVNSTADLAKIGQAPVSKTEADLASINLVTATLPMHVSMPPGTARIRFVVRDMEGGRVGTADLKP